jgi:uncharacterized NAD(P)/FAD-binding protein YdhS
VSTPDTPPSDHRSIAIIGGGFSGMAVAVHLLRKLRSPTTVWLVNRTGRFGRGLAYGTNSRDHLLNVPAGRMGLDPAHEAGFIDYLQRCGAPYQASDFVPRRLYGHYLESELLAAQTVACRGVELQLLSHGVTAITPGAGPATVRLALDDGTELPVDLAVLAFGNLPPETPGLIEPHWRSSGRLVEDPWARQALHAVAPDDALLLLGTGLTAFDVVTDLLDRGHRGPLYMLSRRGLMPQRHRQQETAPAARLVPDDFLAGSGSVRASVRAVRQLIRVAEAAGHDWRDVIGGLRPHTPRLWQQLDEPQRRQFLRHVRPIWEVHRHRAAPEIHARLDAAAHRGQLVQLAGRLVDGGQHPADPRLVSYRPRGSAEIRALAVDWIVNCTGPSSNLLRSTDPLVCQLLATGQLQPDPLSQGLRVGAEGGLLDTQGRASDRLFYVGPLLKADLWEATAVPELRRHAKVLAQRLATRLWPADAAPAA